MSKEELENMARKDGRIKPTFEQFKQFYDEFRKVNPNIWYDWIMENADKHIENWMPCLREHSLQYYPKEEPLAEPFVEQAIKYPGRTYKSGEVPVNPINNLWTPADINHIRVLLSTRKVKMTNMMAGYLIALPGQSTTPWLANKEEVYFLTEGEITVFYKREEDSEYKKFIMKKNDFAYLPPHWIYWIKNENDTGLPGILFFVVVPARYPIKDNIPITPKK
jgi:mannose-6-phosphate isomerase-like protein (cupin superfamily)